MPGYKGHLAGGGLACLLAGALMVLLVGSLPDTLRTGILCALVLLGSLFPDVDTNSKGQHLFYGILLLVDGVLIAKGLYKWAAILGLVSMLPALGSHRGWTHTWWAMLLVPLAGAFLSVWLYGVSIPVVLPYYGAFVLGYASHLALDRCW